MKTFIIQTLCRTARMGSCLKRICCRYDGAVCTLHAIRVGQNRIYIHCLQCIGIYMYIYIYIYMCVCECVCVNW